MDISYFDLHSVNFEVRFDRAYLLWDRAGAIWQNIHKAYPNIKPREVNPGKVTMTIDQRFQLTTEMDKLIVNVFLPPNNVDDYVKLCEYFISMSIEILQVTLFSRIGLRSIYRRDFKNREEASAALISTKMMKIPEGMHFGIEGLPMLPRYSMRWEGDKRGVQVNFQAQERKILVEPVMGEPTVEGVDKDLFELIYDIDYFTIGTVEVGQFRASDWITNAMRVIRRDSKVFLEG
jgi:hypothetical protein